MRSFPPEFSDFLDQNLYARAKAGLAGRPKSHFAWFPGLVSPNLVDASIAVLEERLRSFLKPWRAPIPKSTITKMRRNFCERLPKTVRNLTVSLNNPRCRAFAEAKRTGLVAMLQSPSMHSFAELISGFVLADDPGMQVILYQPGDYVGPHNDHHPEDANLRRGYVDLQITLANDFVRRQLFIYEVAGYFNQSIDVGVRSGVSVSCLPFWHQVTPLEAKIGSEDRARRWLLLVSWEKKRCLN